MAARLQSFCLNKKLELNREGKDQFQRCAELGKSDPYYGDLPTWPCFFLKLSREQGSHLPLPGYIHCSLHTEVQQVRQQAGHKEKTAVLHLN